MKRRDENGPTPPAHLAEWPAPDTEGYAEWWRDRVAWNRANGLAVLPLLQGAHNRRMMEAGLPIRRF